MIAVAIAVAIGIGALVIAAGGHRAAPESDRPHAPTESRATTTAPTSVATTRAPPPATPVASTRDQPSRESANEQAAAVKAVVESTTSVPQATAAPVDPDAIAEFRTGSFDLPTTVPDNASATCFYVIPTTSARQPTRRGRYAVYFMHFPGDLDFAHGPLFERIAHETGMTVFGVRFNLNEAQSKDYTDRSRVYYYHESGAHDAIIAAQDRMVELIGTGARPMLMFGESGGGSAVQQFVECHPDRVRGAAMTGGLRLQFTAKADLPWLILHTRGDDVTGANQAVVKSLKAHAISPTYVTTPPDWSLRGQAHAKFMHCPDAKNRRLSISWLAGIGDLLIANNGSLPHTALWPGVVAGGDLRLPSAAAVEALQTMAPEPEILTVRGKYGDRECTFNRPPPATPPTRLVLYIPNDQAGVPSRLYDLEYLAESGNAAAIVPPDGSCSLASVLMASTRTAPSLTSVPVCILCGDEQSPVLDDLVAFARLHPVASIVWTGASATSSARLRKWAADPALSATRWLVLRAAQPTEGAITWEPDVESPQVDLIAQKHIERACRCFERAP